MRWYDCGICSASSRGDSAKLPETKTRPPSAAMLAVALTVSGRPERSASRGIFTERISGASRSYCGMGGSVSVTVEPLRRSRSPFSLGCTARIHPCSSRRADTMPARSFVVDSE